MAVLERILEAKRTQIATLRRQQLPEPPTPRPVRLRRRPGQPLHLIAEIKRRSPSAGQLSTRLTVAERAAAYERAGARMVSVLCDSEFFGGDFSHLAEARQRCSVPLLCKDFIIDESQLDAAHAWGADAVLLIARCLSPRTLDLLRRAAHNRGLEALVEVTTEDEARMALDSGASLIGVNARDLDTLEVDPERAMRVLTRLPRSVTSLRLSGIATAADVGSVAQSGVHAALIGESLMRVDNPEPLLAAMVAAAKAGSSPPA